MLKKKRTRTTDYQAKVEQMSKHNVGGNLDIREINEIKSV
jgi:hypothetical protein